MDNLTRLKKLAWSHKARVRSVRLSKSPRHLRKQGKTKKKSCIELSKTAPKKKAPSLLPKPKLLLQRKRQAKIKVNIKAKTETLQIICNNCNKKDNYTITIPWQTTSYILCNHYTGNCKSRDWYQNDLTVYVLHLTSGLVSREQNLGRDEL